MLATISPLGDGSYNGADDKNLSVPLGDRPMGFTYYEWTKSHLLILSSLVCRIRVSLCFGKVKFKS